MALLLSPSPPLLQVCLRVTSFQWLRSYSIAEAEVPAMATDVILAMGARATAIAGETS